MADIDYPPTLPADEPLSNEASEAIAKARIAHAAFVEVTQEVAAAKAALDDANRRYRLAEKHFERVSTNALSIVVTGQPAQEEP